jgi:hypothetical protein
LGFGLDNYFVLVLKKYLDIELILSFVKAILILLYDKKKYGIKIDDEVKM